MKLHFMYNELNPNLGEKMNYFVEYFSFVNEIIGFLPIYPLDTPLSLVDKILFQLKNNPKKCNQYIDNHLNQLRPFIEDLRESFETFNDLKPLVERHFNEKSRSVNSNNSIVWQSLTVIKTYEFKNVLELVKRDLLENFRNILVDGIYSFVICKHKLRFHKKDINRLTSLLVADLRLDGYSKESLKKIFQDKIIVETESGLFRDQFYKLKEVIRFKEQYFFFKINNCFPVGGDESDFCYKVNNVTFLSYKHKICSSVKKSMLTKGFINEFNKKKVKEIFFRGKKHILCFIKLKYIDEKVAVSKAIEIINKELLEFKLKCTNSNEHIYLEKSNYLYCETLKEFSGFSYSFLNIEYLSQDKYDVNMISVLSEISTEAKDEYLFHLPKLWEAQYNKSITLYWIFLEALIKSNIQSTFAKIQTKNRIAVRRYLKQMLSNIFHPFNVSSSKTGLDISYDIIDNENEFYKFLNKNKKSIKSPAVLEIIKVIDNLFSKKNESIWNEYYFSIAKETYEYRNAKLHKNNVNEYSEIKLSQILPEMVKYFNWFIYSKIKKDKVSTLEKAFD